MKKDGGIVDNNFIYKDETQLTVRKTCVFFAGDGFSVYDSSGDLVFRVDSYAIDCRDHAQLVLMDSSGRCLLTVRRKRPSLHQRWEGFLGERMEGHKAIFSIRRSSMIGRSTVTVEMYNDPNEEYQIEGSFANRCCTIYKNHVANNYNKEPMAEIKRKVDCSTSNNLLGIDVFSLFVKPGFDAAFAMGLVLVLDQINADDRLDIDDSTDSDDLDTTSSTED